jgi:hypothetical protein
MAEAAPPLAVPAQTGLSLVWERVVALVERIRHHAEAGRDLHLDFLRGWCIFSMVVDHAAGDRHSLLFSVTGNGPWPLTGAHGFVTLSGTVMGLLYAKVMAREGARNTLGKLGRRAFKLYLVAIALGFFDIAWGFVPWQTEKLRSLSWDAIRSVVTLQGSDDLMTFYVTLVILAAGALLLLHRRLWWVVLGLSLAAWMVHQVNERWLNPPIVYFVPLADWQLLFMVGMIIGYHRSEIAALLTGLRRVAFLVLLLGSFALLLCIQFLVNTGRVDAPEWVSRFAADAWQGYDHNPPAHMLTLFVYMLSLHRLTAWAWQPLKRLLGWFLIPLGQSALYVYAVHTVLVFYVLQSLDRFKALEGWPLTLALLGLMLLLWAMVKRRLLFWLIPR